jgi:hypothetical protein
MSARGAADRHDALPSVHSKGRSALGYEPPIDTTDCREFPSREPRVRKTEEVTLTRDCRPVWLLDVDGVLNAARPGWDEDPDQGQAYVDGVAYLLRWAPGLTRRVTALSTAGAVEVRWATTWVDHILQVERLLRLPALSTAFCGLKSAAPVDPAQLKLQAALDVVEVEGRPLIWTDDDAIPGMGPFLERIHDAGLPVLLLAPHTRHGLQPEDLDRIDDFVAGLTALAS